jgi:shikimate dehydrogenase
VLGHPVGHSRSPLLHGYWLRTLALPGTYELADVPPEALPAFFANLHAQGFVGGNVTVPHKVAAMAYMAALDDAAQAIGAVNTIWRDGEAWIGGNTDAAGFLAHLDEAVPGWDAAAGEALILGAGGAARAAAYALLGRGLAIRLANRTRARGEALAAHFGSKVTAHAMAEVPALLARADLLVNTTSLGMAGKPELPIDLAPMPARGVVYDVVYVPLQTPLLDAAQRRGLRAVDGLGMLLHQATGGFARWFGRTPTVTAELRALLEADIRAALPPA